MKIAKNKKKILKRLFATSIVSVPVVLIFKNRRKAIELGAIVYDNLKKNKVNFIENAETIFDQVKHSVLS